MVIVQYSLETKFCEWKPVLLKQIVEWLAKMTFFVVIYLFIK